MFPKLKFDDVPLERRWRVIPVPPGTDVRGWIIGPVVGAVVHWSGDNSKPCRHAMSGGKLFCNCQRIPLASRKIGYLPYHNNHGEKVVIILSNQVAAQAEKLKHGDPIKLVRPSTPKAPLKIEVWPAYECGEEKTKRVRKWQPCDIQPWLLHLWQDPLLTRFFNEPESIRPEDAAPPAIAQSEVTANNSDG